MYLYILYLCTAIRYIVDMSAVHTFVYYNILHNMGILRAVNEDDEEEEEKKTQKYLDVANEQNLPHAAVTTTSYCT